MQAHGFQEALTNRIVDLATLGEYRQPYRVEQLQGVCRFTLYFFVQISSRGLTDNRAPGRKQLCLMYVPFQCCTSGMAGLGRSSLVWEEED